MNVTFNYTYVCMHVPKTNQQIKKQGREKNLVVKSVFLKKN